MVEVKVLLSVNLIFVIVKESFFFSGSPTKVTGVKFKEEKLSWENLAFNIWKPKHKFKLLFKNGSNALFNYTANKKHFSPVQWKM